MLNMPSDTDCAKLAALIVGEGHISTGKNKDIRIYNSDPEVILEAARLLGYFGRVCTHWATTEQVNAEPTRKRFGTRITKPRGYAALCANEAVATCLMAVRPYMFGAKIKRLDDVLDALLPAILKYHQKRGKIVL